MKKIALITTSALLIILLTSYTLLFTSPGNNLLRPYIESKINESSPLKLTLSEFILRLDRIQVLLVLDEENTFFAKGKIAPFSQSFDIDYTLSLNELSHLSTLAQQKLSGAFQTEGKVKGDTQLFTVKGASDFAKSESKYTIVVEEFKVAKAALKLSNAQLQKLFIMSGQKAYAKGKLDLHVQLNELQPKQMKGSVSLKLKEATLNAKALKEEFGLVLSRTNLSSEFKATLDEDKVKYLLSVQSELAKIFSKGGLNVSKKSIESNYTINIKELALLKSITNAPIRGPFATQGKIQGDEKLLFIKGRSDVAASDTSYDLELKALKPSRLITHIKKAELDQLLYLLGEPKYAQAQLDANIQLNDLTPENLNGEAIVTLSKGAINQKVMRQAFEVNLPKTHFNFNSKTDLKADAIKYALDLNSNLAKISSQGKVKPKDLSTELSYSVNIKEFSLLKPLTKLDFRGPLATSGKVTGDEKKMQVIGNSNLASSKTNYSLTLKELQASEATLSVKNAQLSKLLYFSAQANYAEGLLNFNTTMTKLDTPTGDFKLNIKKGLVHKQAVLKDFNITLPYTKFSLQSQGEIKENKLLAQSTLDSNLAVLKIQDSQLNIENASLKSDYELFIPYLQRLEPIIEKKLYGEFKANGEIEKNSVMKVTMHSNSLQGELNAKLVDEKLSADFKALRALKILQMLGYPEVIDAPLNGTLTYNIASQIGKLDARFDKAVLTPSKMTNLINSFSRTDLTKERFNEGRLISNINKEIIKSNLQMKSKKAQVQSEKFIINSKKQLIDARFAVQIKKYPGDILVKGNINSPSVKLDAKSMITPEIEEKVGKEINRFLKKLF